MNVNFVIVVTLSRDVDSLSVTSAVVSGSANDDKDAEEQAVRMTTDILQCMPSYAQVAITWVRAPA